jgi:hypothetical protein
MREYAYRFCVQGSLPVSSQLSFINELTGANQCKIVFWKIGPSQRLDVFLRYCTNLLHHTRKSIAGADKRVAESQIDGNIPMSLGWPFLTVLKSHLDHIVDQIHGTPPLSESRYINYGRGLTIFIAHNEIALGFLVCSGAFLGTEPAAQWLVHVQSFVALPAVNWNGTTHNILPQCGRGADTA